jgi:hypothetical protein
MLLELNVTTRFVTVAPFTSFTVTERVAVALGASASVVGSTATLPTAVVVTVMAAVALCPALVAVIVAEPMPIAVTTPSDPTVATPVFELDQTTGVPVTTAPVASRVVAASCVV